MIIELNMVQTIALSVIVLLIGEFLVKRISFLEKYCIPAPVVGGLIFALVALGLKMGNILEFNMDMTLKDLTMTIFFTSVGLGASFGLLKKGGAKVVIFLGAAVGLVILQNVVGIGVAKVLGQDPLLGMVTGSIPMTGGHGTSASFGPLIEDMGLAGADVIAAAAATFGLIAGSMIGGPVGKRLIEKNNLKPSAEDYIDSPEDNEDAAGKPLVVQNFYTATFELLITMGVGTIFSNLLQKTGMTFPPYIGAMLAGAIIRNIGDSTKIYNVPAEEIDILGGIALSLFLSMALMSLKLWELADLMGPMLIILAAQVLLMLVYSIFVTFNVMGRNYDAAILAAGHCGFGMGATPNGIANMTSVTKKYGPSPTAFFILPLAGSLFVDFFNSAIIAVFLNFIG